MNAAESVGVNSIWIYRVREEFASGFGKELLKKLGIEGEYEGIGGFRSIELPFFLFYDKDIRVKRSQTGF